MPRTGGALSKSWWTNLTFSQWTHIFMGKTTYQQAVEMWRGPCHTRCVCRGHWRPRKSYSPSSSWRHRLNCEEMGPKVWVIFWFSTREIGGNRIKIKEHRERWTLYYSYYDLQYWLSWLMVLFLHQDRSRSSPWKRDLVTLERSILCFWERPRSCL